jgi:hypothetical protein
LVQSNSHLPLKLTLFSQLAATDLRLRKEFFIAYTRALEDFLQTSQSTDLNQTQIEQEVVTSTPMTSKKPSTHNTNHKYSVYGKMLDLEEIEKLNQQEWSSEQLEENEKRKKYSNDLMKFLLSDECRVSLFLVL